MKKKFINNEEAAEIISQQSNEFAVIHNPEYIFPPLEIYPLAEKLTTPADSLTAIVMGLDGTIATTEELGIYALEYMVRQISGRYTRESWKGLDPFIDYPNIIGNSTTKHIEYLISRYHNFINPDCLKQSYFYAAIWTITSGLDKNRADDVKTNLINLGCKKFLNDPKLAELISTGIFDEDLIQDYFLPKYGNEFDTGDFNSLVRAAMDIFYQRYHEILQGIKSDKGKILAGELLQDGSKHLIESMPGTGIFLALIKGWLGNDIINLIPRLDESIRIKNQDYYQIIDLGIVSSNLSRLAKIFEKKPLSIAVVTSSVYYEVEIILTELFKAISSEIENWSVPAEKKFFLKNKFSDFKIFFNTIVTADDSSEIRLKPHRDLYSIALHKLGIPKNKFDQVIALEDSESGIVSVRSAGIGRSVAVPFSKTSGQDFSAATYVQYGGIPELLLYNNLFVKP